MLVHEAQPGRILLLRFNPGDDVLLALRQAVADNGIRNGAILAGIGSLTSYHFHVVSSTDLPPENAFVQGEGAYDILNINGYVFDGRVHAHITFSDTEIAMGGHLEEGCRVLTFAIITIAEVSATGLGEWDTVRSPA
ncbi:MAG: DNA-binding protein [Chloroflexota bacterium]|nr:DNA-binding protein [Chloroflexota bacterium]